MECPAKLQRGESVLTFADVCVKFRSGVRKGVFVPFRHAPGGAVLFRKV